MAKYIIQWVGFLLIQKKLAQTAHKSDKIMNLLYLSYQAPNQSTALCEAQFLSISKINYGYFRNLKSRQFQRPDDTAYLDVCSFWQHY